MVCDGDEQKINNGRKDFVKVLIEASHVVNQRTSGEKKSCLYGLLVRMFKAID